MTRTQRPYVLAAVGAAALVGALAACQELDVTNPNEADRRRAITLPDAVESFVSTSFPGWWQWVHDNDPAWITSTVADEFTSGFADFGQLESSTEPRQAWINSPVYARAASTEDPWYGLHSSISTVNDALSAIDSGMVIDDETNTARVEAFGKFVQGLGRGYVSLLFDQGFVIPEDLDVTVIPPSEAAGYLQPHEEVMDAAIASMEEAIALAEANDFTYPNGAWLFTETSSDGLVRLANSFLARFKAYAPRTRAERDAVDWNEIIALVDAGIQQDFAPIGVAEVLFDDWKRLTARVRNTTRPGDFGRLDYWLVGFADSTEGFQNWKNAPLLDRVPFQLRTKDRRIQGTGTAGSKGKYFGYNAQTLFAASRGTYHQSFYYIHRFGTGDTWQTGPLVAMTVTEMNLLKAEALIRLGRADEAVPLINITRVANGELPPVTLDGPPVEPGCVPRKLDGTCGSLWDALRYEKRIEMAGVDPMVAYFDARGWQTLIQNSFVQLPIPGRELETLGLQLYSFGGGQPSSAPAPDPERCPGPVALPRCP
jgi:hypothetical protein